MYAISNDHLGRPEVVTNTSGAVVWRARNLAYHREQTVNHSGFGSLGLSFPGQYLDAESGMADNWHACTTRAVGGIRKAIRLGSKVD